MPLLRAESPLGGHEHLLILNCHLKDDFSGPLALCVRVDRGETLEDGELHCRVTTQRKLGGTSERVTVAPYHSARKAIPRRCWLYPRFSWHRHSHDHDRFASGFHRIHSVPRIWVETLTDRNDLTFNLVGREPERQWSRTGLFAPGGQVGSGQCIWLMQLWRYGHADVSEIMQSELLETWAVGLAFDINNGTFRIRLFDAAERVDSGQQAADLLERPFPECRSITFGDCIRVVAKGNIMQTIFDHYVDRISVSAERVMKESPGPNGTLIDHLRSKERKHIAIAPQFAHPPVRLNTQEPAIEESSW